MKKLLVVMSVMMGLVGVSSQALAISPMFDLARTSATAESESTSSSQSSAGAYNGGIQLNMAAGPSKIEYEYGSQTIRNTPGVVLGGFSNSFSADYCGGTMQGGASGPGISFSFGGPKIDFTCTVLRSIEKIANLAQQRFQVNKDEALKLMRAADLLACRAVKGVTDVALEEAGIDCGSASPANKEKQATNTADSSGIPGH